MPFIQISNVTKICFIQRIDTLSYHFLEQIDDVVEYINDP